MRFARTDRFNKDFEKLTKEQKDLARKQFLLFKEDYNHNSLKVRKMRGFDNIYEGHVSEGCVFTFHWEDNKETGERTAVFRRIGSHDIYKKP